MNNFFSSENRSPLYPRESSCCLTGHRKVPETQKESIKKALFTLIYENYQLGIKNYYAGGALGFDMLASYIIIDMKKSLSDDITLNIVLPCANYNKFWSIPQKHMIAEIISKADSAVYLSPEYYTGCMSARNRFMVDRSSVCIAYLSQMHGGTLQTVEYAKHSGIRVINISDSI